MSLERNEAREIRGRILKILNVDYPREVSDRVIALTLGDINHSVSSGVLAGHLAYLADKGYLEMREVRSPDLPTLTITVARLTAEGKDLLEGNRESDPGVRV